MKIPLLAFLIGISLFACWILVPENIVLFKGELDNVVKNEENIISPEHIRDSAWGLVSFDNLTKRGEKNRTILLFKWANNYTFKRSNIFVWADNEESLDSLKIGYDSRGYEGGLYIYSAGLIFSDPTGGAFKEEQESNNIWEKKELFTKNSWEVSGTNDNSRTKDFQLTGTITHFIPFSNRLFLFGGIITIGVGILIIFLRRRGSNQSLVVTPLADARAAPQL